MIRFLVCLLVSLGLTNSNQAAQLMNTYTVNKVYDGDTITIVNNTGITSALIRVRFICVDAPELDQIPWGVISLNRLK